MQWTLDVIGMDKSHHELYIEMFLQNVVLQVHGNLSSLGDDFPRTHPSALRESVNDFDAEKRGGPGPMCGFCEAANNSTLR